MHQAYVLLSGGIDSTTCLYHARNTFGSVEGLSIFYGQRHSKEIQYAKLSCEHLGITHRELDISSVMPLTVLTDKGAMIPDVSYAELQGVSPTYAPFRNGLLLSTAAAYIQGKRSKDDDDEHALYFGAHAEDARAWAYPDCTPEFIGAMANALYVGTYRQLRLYTPLEWMTKPEIITMGERLGVDWSLTWSCYRGGDVHCGTCPTCRARMAGFAVAGVIDPTEYAVAA